MKRLSALLLPLLACAGHLAAQTSYVITTSSLPNGVVNQLYQAGIQTNSPVNAQNCVVESGVLPPGIERFTSGTGCLLYGTPTSAGTFAFTFRVVNQQGAQTNPAFFSITITPTAGGVLQITTVSIPPATVGASYSFTFQTNLSGSSSAPALNWSILSGSLPFGLFLASTTGVLSGTPTNTGSYTFEVSVVSSQLEASDRRVFTMLVSAGVLRIIENSLVPSFGVQGQSYTTTLHGEGGALPYRWTMITPGLTGLTMDAVTGIITGTPESSGNFTLQITLTDAAGGSTTRNFSLFVATPLSVVTTTLPNGSPGTNYNQQLQAGGGQSPYTWAVTAGSLPPGITLTTSSGVLNGVPTAEGRYAFTVRVTDAGNRTATRDLTITVGQVVQITTSSLPEGAVGTAYSANLAATGGQSPYTWSVSSGTLPAGLVLAASTGAISGTPTTIGSSTFTITVTDSQNSTAQRTFSINVVSPLSITTTAVAEGLRGVAYSQPFGATGGTPPYNWSLAGGSLPAGLTLNGSSALISGTPTVSGAFSFSLQVRDALGQTATRAYLLNIGEPLTITTGNLTGTATVAFSQQLAATGGTAPLSWSVAGGSLPAGLNLNPSTGAITGTPTVAGSSTITFQVTDGRSQSATKAIVITINLPQVPAVSLTVANPGGGTIGPGQQPAVSVTLGSPFPSQITGTLTLAFAPTSGGDDTTVRFSNGLRTLAFTIPQGSTTATFPSVQTASVITGTVAGTITITTQMRAGETDITPTPPPTQRIEIAPGPPVISSVRLEQTGTGVNVIVTGFATTREVTTGIFRFAASTGTSLAQSEFTVQLGSVFSAFFPTISTGSTFTLTLPVGVSGGPGTSIISVSVTLTNARGNSSTVNP